MNFNENLFLLNSIRIRKTILQLIKNETPDFVCIQEIKSSNDVFPKKEFEDLNYFVHVNGMPSYNGVSILIKTLKLNLHILMLFVKKKILVILKLITRALEYIQYMFLLVAKPLILQ